MTENKRFIMEESEGQDTIYDNEGLDDYYHLGNDTRDVKALCDLLNEQEETIQDLKCRINSIYAILREEKCSDNRMTEKRFTIGRLKTYVNDNHTNYCYSLLLQSDANHLCDLLNRLHEENMELRQYIIDSRKDNEKLRETLNNILARNLLVNDKIKNEVPGKTHIKAAFINKYIPEVIYRSCPETIKDGCSNCAHHDYDYYGYDFGNYIEEFEICRKGHELHCKECCDWEEK